MPSIFFIVLLASGVPPRLVSSFHILSLFLDASCVAQSPRSLWSPDGHPKTATRPSALIPQRHLFSVSFYSTDLDRRKNASQTPQTSRTEAPQYIDCTFMVPPLKRSTFRSTPWVSWSFTSSLPPYFLTSLYYPRCSARSSSHGHPSPSHGHASTFAILSTFYSLGNPVSTTRSCGMKSSTAHWNAKQTVIVPSSLDWDAVATRRASPSNHPTPSSAVRVVFGGDESASTKHSDSLHITSSRAHL